MPRKTRKPARRNAALEGVKYERALAGFQEELIRPVTLKSLQKWVSEAATDRTKFLHDTVWGTIRWETSVGRSLGPTLASGFRIEHWYHELNWAIQGDGTPVDLSRWVQAPDPSVWDMRDAEGFHQVGYMFRAQRPRVNSVLIAFADRQPWDSPFHLHLKSTYRSILPARQDFWMGEADYAVLDETKVLGVPVRVFG
jgi:hypothetical protein